MQIYNIHEAKTHFSKLIEAALNGEEVIVSKAGEPQVRLVPYHTSFAPRTLGGSWEGKVSMAEDFDDLPEAFRDMIEGKN